MRVPYSYLPRQFADPEPILDQIRNLVKRGDLTLGQPVEEFEQRFAALIGSRFAVAVGSGTDALFLSLKALGIGQGDEVITATNTFVATAGAIETAGARLVFVDCNDQFVMDPAALEAAITSKTKAVVPVHYTGQPAGMDEIEAIARRHNLEIVEDACTAIDGSINGRRCGTIGRTGAFSMHPLKNLNIWGDGGVITTNDPSIARQLRLLRNHGMVDRDTYAFYAYNSRLDTLQAVVGLQLLDQVTAITDKRIEIAARYDRAFADLDQIRIPLRYATQRHVYHMYMIEVDQRDGLLAYLKEQGISAKVHYPTPLHLQPASAHLGYGAGDFPVAEAQARRIISLPVHQYLSDEEIDYVISRVREYYQP